MVSFKVTPQERSVIDQIADRAAELGEKLGVTNIDRLSMSMDLTACHANGNPLRLDELLTADRFDFIHDVFGVSRHIDRATGKLMNCFRPRLSQPSQVAA